ncbi:MAG: hypothetical protein WED05_07465 [Candidatus Atabeyarchaeum deiterrae]
MSYCWLGGIYKPSANAYKLLLPGGYSAKRGLQGPQVGFYAFSVEISCSHSSHVRMQIEKSSAEAIAAIKLGEKSRRDLEIWEMA